jgi:hypothetical protein
VYNGISSVKPSGSVTMALVLKEASTFEMNPLLPSSRQKMEAISFQNAKASSSSIWHSNTEVSLQTGQKTPCIKIIA